MLVQLQLLLKRRSPLFTYSAAVALAVLAQAVRAPLHPATLIPFITYVPFLLASAAFGRIGPGIVTTVLCVLECVYFAVEPVGSFAIRDLHNLAGLAVLAMTGVISSLTVYGYSAAQDRRRASEERFRALITATSDVVYRASPDWREMRFLHGREFSALINSPSYSWLHQHIPPEDHPIVMEAVRAAIRDRSAFELEHRTLREDGSIGWTFSRAAPLLNADSEITEWFGTASDITKRKTAEEALSRSQAHLVLAQSIAHLGSWERNLATGELWWSDEVYRIFGLEPGAVNPSQEFFARVPPEEAETIREAVGEAVNSGRAYNLDHHIVLPNGTVKFVHEQADVMRDATGRPELLLGTVLDITGRKQVEMDLRRSNEDLEQFAYAVSHDLQEPLRMIRTYTELLARRCSGCTEKPSEFFDFILGGATRMQVLIDAMLELSRAGRSDQGSFTRVDLNEAVSWARQNLAAVIAESGAELICEPLPVVVGDLVQLGTVFQNLIGNAIKYRSDKPLRITVRAACLKDGHHIAVQDNGRGIDPKYHARIFGLFKRLHSDSKIPGTGIGLTISQRIIERHGGRMWVDSQVGVGSTFTFTLPSVDPAG